MLTTEKDTQSVFAVLMDAHEAGDLASAACWNGTSTLLRCHHLPGVALSPIQAFLPSHVEVLPLAPWSCYLSDLDDPTSVLGFTFVILQGSVLFLTSWQSSRCSEAGLPSWAVSGRPWITAEPGGQGDFRASLLEAPSSLCLS